MFRASEVLSCQPAGANSPPLQALVPLTGRADGGPQPWKTPPALGRTFETPCVHKAAETVGSAAAASGNRGVVSPRVGTGPKERESNEVEESKAAALANTKARKLCRGSVRVEDTVADCPITNEEAFGYLSLTAGSVTPGESTTASSIWKSDSATLPQTGAQLGAPAGGGEFHDRMARILGTNSSEQSSSRGMISNVARWTSGLGRCESKTLGNASPGRAISNHRRMKDKNGQIPETHE